MRLTLLFSLVAAASVLHAAPPPPVPLGPALTALGGVVAPSYLSRDPVLQFKSETPLSEEAWNEIEALKPKQVAAAGKGIDDSALARLAKLPLELLSLQGPSVTDAGWIAFKEMKGLQKLTLGHNLTWKGTGADALKDLPALSNINIGGSSFGDPGVAALASMKQLQALALFHVQVTDAGLAAFANNTTLESLKLSPQMTPRLTDGCLKTVSTMKGLKEFSLGDTVLTYDGGLKLLKNLPQLQKLTLEKVGLSDTDLAKLKADLPKVEIKFTPATPEAVDKWHTMQQRLNNGPAPSK